MTRWTMLFVCLIACALTGAQASAADPPKRLTREEREELEAKVQQRSAAGVRAYQSGKYADAVEAFQEVLAVSRRLYPKEEHPDGHANLVASLNNLSFILNAQGQLVDAEQHLREALDMTRRLYQGDHPLVATELNSLGVLLNAQGKLGDAERLLRDALDMRRRLFKADDPQLATTLNNLAYLYHDQGKYADAERLYREALAMSRRVFRGDHPNVSRNLNNLAALLRDEGKLADSERLFQEALEMNKRLFPGDHPRVAQSLNNLAYLFEAQGKMADAERFQRESLDMRVRLFPVDHPHIANSLSNLAGLLQSQGKLDDAERLFRKALDMNKRLYPDQDHGAVAQSLIHLGDLLKAKGRYTDAERLLYDALEMRRRMYSNQDHPAVVQSLISLGKLLNARGDYSDADSLLREALEMSRRFVAVFADQKSEAEALNLIATLPLVRDVYLSNSSMVDARPEDVYAQVWSSKGLVSRVYEQRLQAARAAAAEPRSAELLAELADARRRRAELILAPAVKDPTTRKKRTEEIEQLDAAIRELGRNIRPLLPTIERAEKLARATPADLQRALPSHAVVVDFLRYAHVERDNDKPDRAGQRRIERYVAFVVTQDKVAWIDLGPAAPIEEAVAAWRAAILGGNEVPVTIPGQVRELVWARVRKEFPQRTKTLYVSPDLSLTGVPWGALPGDQPDTILLEEFAVATIPHAQFLLDQLWFNDAPKTSPPELLVVGGVKYDIHLGQRAPERESAADMPLVKPGTEFEWPFLPGTATEANGVANAAAKRNLLVTALTREKATKMAVLEDLPRANYAHIATHGFFADPSFRSVFKLEQADYQKAAWGERVGPAANNPLVMTGLVFAGANNGEAPGYGIATGEALIGLNLSRLELAVLSACETGLGDVAGGEGTFGLQRAFHYAGAKNVIASLWKVPDESTAALMGLFYRNLWEQNLSPMESLRQAQLEIYRNPNRIPRLASAFRGLKLVANTDGEAGSAAAKDNKAHTRLWAAFTLSGPGQ